MSNIDDHLRPGEEVLYVARPTKITLAPLVLLAIAAVAIGAAVTYQVEGGSPALVIGVTVAGLILLAVLIKWIVISSNVFVLTDQRLMKLTGILTKRSTDSHLEKINNVEHVQTIWGRLFGYGDVEVDTASETGTTVFRMINSPLTFKTMIIEAAERYRGRRYGGAATAPTGATRLRELQSLLDDGLITREEFDARRAKILEEL